MIRPNDEKWIGQKFGKLTVRGAVYNGRRWLWECDCECGGKTITYPNLLIRGKQKACACGKSVTFREMHFKHGDAGTRLYNIWKGMRKRCGHNRDSKHYGDRGIVVCDEWDDYLTFKEWAMSHGYEDDLTIERIDVNGNYCPENCKWIPHTEQPKNTRKTIIVTHNGITAPVSWWADELGLKRPTVYTRIQHGMSPEEALGL